MHEFCSVLSVCGCQQAAAGAATIIIIFMRAGPGDEKEAISPYQAHTIVVL